LLTGDAQADDLSAQAALVEKLREWTEFLQLPRLGAYGLAVADIEKVVANARGNSMLTNPLVLDDAEIAALVRARL
jgi:alcohol dehydrogenase